MKGRDRDNVAQTADDVRERRTKTPQQALSVLMRLAARSEKSSGDALRLMRNWGVEHSEQQKVLAKLTEQRFIDDSRYAAAYVREKSSLNGWGIHKIRRMLASKGIAGQVADEALKQLKGIDNRKLDSMLARKLKGMAPDDYRTKGKLLRYGLSLGYEYDEVAEAVDRVVKEKDIQYDSSVIII